jgi:hypothetical protein
VPPSGAESARRRAATGLRGVVDVLVELVAVALVGLGLGGVALGALLLARGGLGLVVGGVGARDGLLELGQRRREVRAGQLFERLGGDVLVRIQRVAGIGWLEGTTSRVACCSAAITISARP